MIHMKKMIAAILITASAMIPSAAVSAEDSQTAYNGYVLYSGTVVADVNGISQQTQGAVIVKTDGTTDTIATLYDKRAFLGDIVTVTPSEFGFALTNPVSGKKISGKVNAAAKTIGSTPVADDVRIIDIAAQPFIGSRDCAVIDLDRIDGLSLESRDVKFCKTDTAGRITELYLNDVTGDAYTYGIVDSLDSENKETFVLADGWMWKSDIISSAKPFSAVRIAKDYSYEMDPDTREGKLIYNDDEYCRFAAIAQLHSYGAASAVKDGAAVIGGSSYKLSNNTAVYYKENTIIVQTSLESVANGNFRLTCFYDKAESDGGRIRVIIAERK